MLTGSLHIPPHTHIQDHSEDDARTAEPVLQSSSHSEYGVTAEPPAVGNDTLLVAPPCFWCCAIFGTIIKSHTTHA